MSLKRVGAVVFASAIGLSLAAIVPAQGGTSGGSGPSPGVKRVTVNGQKVLQSQAKVVKVLDGDTMRVDIKGDNRGPVVVRNAGMNTFEKGDCHYGSATRTLKKLTSRQVILRSATNAQKVNKNSGRNRLQRFVFTKKGVDLQEQMIARGLALPYNFSQETMGQALYSQRAQEAAARGVGMFDTDACKPGPVQEAALDLVVHYNASGNDRANLNGKFVRIVNNGAATVDLSGWYILTGRQRFHFPGGTTIAPGSNIKLHMGSGTNTATDLYWGGKEIRLPVPGNSRYQGIGVLLMDPDGDARFWSFYPCRVDCGHPAQGAFNVSIVHNPPGNPDLPNDETVSFTNVSSQRVDMTYLVAEVRNETYEFQPGVYVDPGETLVMRMGKGTPDRLTHYLGMDSKYLPGPVPGGLIELRDDRAVQLACYSWGKKWKC